MGDHEEEIACIEHFLDGEISPKEFVDLMPIWYSKLKGVVDIRVCLDMDLPKSTKKKVYKLTEGTLSGMDYDDFEKVYRLETDENADRYFGRIAPSWVALRGKGSLTVKEANYISLYDESSAVVSKCYAICVHGSSHANIGECQLAEVNGNGRIKITVAADNVYACDYANIWALKISCELIVNGANTTVMARNVSTITTHP